MFNTKHLNNMKSMKETFKSIEGYEGMYEVSSLGRVKSLPRNGSGPYTTKEIYLKPGTNGGRYKIVCLTKNKTHKMILVHRLVAKAFILNPDNKMQVNHINAIKIDNNVNNLEWCTAKENTHHAMKNNLMDWSKPCKGEASGKSKLKIKEVVEIKNKFINGLNDHAIAKEYNVHPATIWQIRKGNNWAEVKI